MKKIISRIFLSINILLVILMVMASGFMLFVKNSNPPTVFGTSYYIIENSGSEGQTSVLVGVKKQSYNKAGDLLLMGGNKSAVIKKVEKAEDDKLYFEGEEEPVTVHSDEYIGTVRSESKFWGGVFSFCSNEQNFSLILLVIGAVFVLLLIILVLAFALTSRKIIDEGNNLDNEHQQIEVLKLMQDGTGEIPLSTEEKRDSPFQDPLRARGFANSLSYIAKENPPSPEEDDSVSVEELVNAAFSQSEQARAEQTEEPLQPEKNAPEEAPQPVIEEIQAEPDFGKLYQKEVEEQTKIYVLKKDREFIPEEGVKLYVKPEKKPAPEPVFAPEQKTEEPARGETDLSDIYSMLDDIEDNFRRTFEDDDD